MAISVLGTDAEQRSLIAITATLRRVDREFDAMKDTIEQAKETTRATEVEMVENRVKYSKLVSLKFIDGEEVGDDDVIVMARQPLTICERIEAKLCRCVCHDKFIARLDLTQGRVTRGAGGRPRGDGIAGAAVFDEAAARDTFNPTMGRSPILDGGGGLPGLELTTMREGQQAALPRSLAVPQSLALPQSLAPPRGSALPQDPAPPRNSALSGGPALPQGPTVPLAPAIVGSQRAIDAREGTEGGDNVTVTRRYSVTERWL